MKLLYIPYSFKFYKDELGIYTLPSYGNEYWEKYLKEFDELLILGEPAKSNTGLVCIDGNISMHYLPPNAKPKDLKNDYIVHKILEKHIKSAEAIFYIVHKILEKHIKSAEAILIQPTSRKGMMAIKLARKYNKPYLIEITGDIYSDLRNSTSVVRRLYSIYLYKRIIKTIYNTEFGLYVTSEYLQKTYPIKGIKCGCTDTNLSNIDDKALANRIKKINEKKFEKPYVIGLIGSYSNKRKGIDTAIKAIAEITGFNVELHILGFGENTDREKWYKYANKYGIKHKIFFDPQIYDTYQVLKWIDEVDICILPSRSEGLPRCIIEANSRACPSIVSEIGGNSELIESKWTHKIGDYSYLAFLIENMLDNPALMIEAAQYNFNSAHKYTIDEQTKLRHEFFDRFKKYAGKMIG